jgi:hypothetical protein
MNNQTNYVLILLTLALEKSGFEISRKRIPVWLLPDTKLSITLVDSFEFIAVRVTNDARQLPIILIQDHKAVDEFAGIIAHEIEVAQRKAEAEADEEKRRLDKIFATVSEQSDLNGFRAIQELPDSPQLDQVKDRFGSYAAHTVRHSIHCQQIDNESGIINIYVLVTLTKEGERLCFYSAYSQQGVAELGKVYTSDYAETAISNGFMAILRDRQPQEMLSPADNPGS